MELLVDIHSIFRWVVLFVAADALVFALLSATGSRPWDVIAERFSFFFPLAMNIQAFLGLVVWVLGARWSGNTFLGWIHPVLMIGAVGLAQVGRARSERADGAQAKGRQAAIFFGLSLLVVLVAIPTGSWPL